MTLLTIDDVRARCIVNNDTGCWIWQGSLATDGTPRMHTIDYERNEKRTMSGPKAMWNIAYGEAPRTGWLVYRRCVNVKCLCPVHLGQTRNRVDLGRHIALNGKRKGNSIEARRANQRLAMAGKGIKPTMPEIVRACRAAGPEVTGAFLAALYGIAPQTVSRIRRGESHRDIYPLEGAPC